MKKRILWMFNHTSLRNFEVPLLIQMGYEVYCPKIYDLEFGDLSASISYEYDDSLTLPKNVLETLNQVNFYEQITPEIMDTINQYFDIAFCMMVPAILDEFATSFHGTIVLQAFGMMGRITYSGIMTTFGYSLLSRIRACGDRFWFAPSYDNIAQIEAPVLSNRTVLLPIGMKNATAQRSWVGGDPRFLFISPKILTDAYYHKVYMNFKKDFGDLPHVIGGAQLQPVKNDPTVQGFLPVQQYAYNMKHLAAMYYHSKEPRHVHYHPLEAVHFGMPLVFLAGGMLEHLGGAGMPGCCNTVSEARSKLRHLLRGDKVLIREITESQEKLLLPFSMEYCRPYWEQGMKQIASSVPEREHITLNTPRKRIAVVMPEMKTIDLLQYSIRFAVALKMGIDHLNASASVVFAYPTHSAIEEKDYFAPLRDAGIPQRAVTFRTKDAAWANRALRLAGYLEKDDADSVLGEVLPLQDKAADFQDCDFVVFTSDETCKPVFCLRPSAFIVQDYRQRYYPKSLSDEKNAVKLFNQRHSEWVLVPSDPVRVDATLYGGLKKEQVSQIPMLLEFPKKPENGEKWKENPYFLWSANSLSRENCGVILETLELYYVKGGKLDCVLFGVDDQYLNSNYKSQKETEKEIGFGEELQKISESTILRKHLYVTKKNNRHEYLQALAGATFVFCPEYGGGNAVITEAAGFAIPALCSDDPGSHYFSSVTGIRLNYTDTFHSEDIAMQLMRMEKNALQYANELPTHTELEQIDYRAKSVELCKIIRQIAAF